ncbi:MAG TPA: efflux RND transporter periplasmic adaptor subunit [Candidatus Acidoferrum sp.]|jgi:RND family efflux transporter MFP subunit|nr:efflux RND transporter periplasmic adaptor subunit [Candidatus Acidoferrum sp.]
MFKKLRSWAFQSLLLVTMAATGATLACSSHSGQNAQAGGAQAMPVKVQEARATPLNDATEYVATLKSRDSAVIMPQVEGQVIKIFVHSGERVGSGAPLMEIDPLKQQATVKSTESSRAAQQANVNWTKQQYERAQGLYSAGVVSKQDLDQAKTAMDAAQAQMDSLDAQVREQQVQLHYYRVVSPWGGIVGDVPVRVGDRVAVTTPLTTVDKPGSLEVYVYVPIEHSSQLKMNLPLQVLDSGGKVLADTRVSFVSPEVDNTTQTVLVKARIANGNDALRQSQFIRARIVWGTHQNPQVPILAVSRLAGQYFAFVAEPQNGGSYVARQKPLKIGQTVGNDYEVQDGIKPGDKVIVSGTQFLMDGAPVVPQS